MTAPAGLCEWCGGQQNWTIHAGSMYVRCKAGCQSLFGAERVNLPRPSEDRCSRLDAGSEAGTFPEAEGVPLEGGAANESEDIDSELPF